MTRPVYLILGVAITLLPHELWKQAVGVWFGLGCLGVLFEIYQALRDARRHEAELLEYDYDWATVTPPGDRGREPYVGETPDC